MKISKRNELFDRNDSNLKIVLIYIVLFLFVAISVYPILNIFSISLRAGGSAFSTSLKIIPDNASFENYRILFEKYKIGSWFINSILISVISTIFGVILSVSAGYAFSRFEFKGRNMGMTLLLVTQMFPAIMMLLPLYLLMIKLNLTDNYFGLVVVYTSTTIPFNVWMMKGYYDTIPKSLEESAYVDGASIYYSFYKIILPLAKPAVALTALFSFMGAWSEYIIASRILSDPNKATLPIGLVNMQGQFATDWGVYSAGALLTAVPVMIIFVSLSKYLVGGLTLGSVKG